MPSQNISKARFWEVNYIFQDAQGSFQIASHKNKYHFDKNVYSTMGLPNPNQYPFTITKFQHSNIND